VSGFALDWLRLRERFDAGSRPAELADGLAAEVRRRAGPHRPARLVDLGAGSGANLRWLAPRIAGDQEWTLVDADARLLAASAGELDAWRLAVPAATAWPVQTVRLDLASELDRLRLGATDGVTCSALLDLVSAGWIERLADALAPGRPPVLAALSVDGELRWDPPHPEDRDVAAALRRDQARDKGFGAALGAAAPAAAARVLAARGYRVEQRASAWRIAAGEAAMLHAMVEGIAAAASAAAAAEAPAIAAWRRSREREIARGGLSLAVGHVDLLALPGPPA